MSARHRPVPGLPRRPVSARKIAANRRNAQHSTGPRSAAGKAISAANARRHGLSVAAPLDHETARAICATAQAWAGPGASTMLLELAQNLVEAEFDLARVLDARAALWRDWPSDPEAIVRHLAAARPAWDRLERYLTRSRSRRRKALLAFDAALLEPERERLRLRQEEAAAARAAAAFAAWEARSMAEGARLARQAERRARRPPRPGCRQRVASSDLRAQEPRASAPPASVSLGDLDGVRRDIKRCQKLWRTVAARWGLAPVHPVDHSFDPAASAADAATDAGLAKRTHRSSDAEAAALSRETIRERARQELARRQLAKQSQEASGAGAAQATPCHAGPALQSPDAVRDGAHEGLAPGLLAKRSQWPPVDGSAQATPGHAEAALLSQEAMREGALRELVSRQLAKQSQKQDPDAGTQVAELPGPRAPPRSGR